MRKFLRSFGFIAIATVLTLGLININDSAKALVPGTNDIISKTSTAAIAGVTYYGSNLNSVLSGDGKVIFLNTSAVMLPTGQGKLYARNIESGLIDRVDVSSSSVTADHLSANYVRDVSFTGRYVIFESQATNLIDGTTLPSGKNRLYLRDMKLGVTSLISQSVGGIASNGTYETSIGVSSDGRFVSFATNASNLHPDATDGNHHLYLLDRATNNLSILDRKADGQLGFTVWNFIGDMSCDGSLIVFQYGGNLDANEYNSKVSTYLLDMRGENNKLTNITKSAVNATFAPSISCNGDYIGFSTASNNLDPSVVVSHNSNHRPYVYDRVNQTFHLVSKTAANTATSASICSTPYMYSSIVQPCVKVSDTGLAVFSANDPVLTGASGVQTYVRNIHSSTTELISRSSSGTPGDGDSMYPSISFDGKKVVYNSIATNLVSGVSGPRAYSSLTGL